MTTHILTPELLNVIAERFKALSEPARLQILNTLRDGPLTVNELVDETGLGQANLSKHLQSLYTAGFVARSKDGRYVIYRLADRYVLKLCDLMCGRIDDEVAAQGRLLRRR